MSFSSLLTLLQETQRKLEDESASLKATLAASKEENASELKEELSRLQVENAALKGLTLLQETESNLQDAIAAHLKAAIASKQNASELKEEMSRLQVENAALKGLTLLQENASEREEEISRLRAEIAALKDNASKQGQGRKAIFVVKLRDVKAGTEATSLCEAHFEDEAAAQDFVARAKAAEQMIRPKSSTPFVDFVVLRLQLFKTGETPTWK